MDYIIELEQETDGRWIAEVINLPGVLVYGTTQDEAMAKAQALVLRVEAEKLENGERPYFNNTLSFKAA
ncbi:MAG: HicB family protein [Flavipsychrobacter sp.]|jgi:predicted RNase H-like HicB family nuclease|nr:HicB family protein [Flavipsychrobacter sp.]